MRETKGFEVGVHRYLLYAIFIKFLYLKGIVHYLDIKTYVYQFFVLIITILIFIIIDDYKKRKMGKYWWKIRPSDYTFLRQGLQNVPKGDYNY